MRAGIPFRDPISTAKSSSNASAASKSSASIYSEDAISDVEQALAKVMAQLDRLCTKGDADQVVSRLLRQFDVVTGLSAWTDPRQIN